VARFSQSNEDEIIADIFARIGTTDRQFVEFGVGKGTQNNTISLLLAGWTGKWFEIRKKCVKSCQRLYAGYPVEIRRRCVTPECVNKTVRSDVDFLSIDIDGNDYAVWQALSHRPRLVCIEYDAVNGTALEPMKALGHLKGYSLVRCSASGVNAFFVRNEERRL
jgi:hypothetical protein